MTRIGSLTGICTGRKPVLEMVPDPRSRGALRQPRFTTAQAFGYGRSTAGYSDRCKAQSMDADTLSDL